MADALSSLIDAKTINSVLKTYEQQLVKSYSKLMRQKFGLTQKEEGDHQLIHQFIDLLHTYKLDYTNSMRGLSDLAQLENDKRFSSWIKRYTDRISRENDDARVALMNRNNPKYILRNYLAEEAIREAEDNKNYEKISVLFKLLNTPFDEHTGFDDYAKEAYHE